MKRFLVKGAGIGLVHFFTAHGLCVLH
jgi:hypothetical protein